MKQQTVKPPFLLNWDQVPLQKLASQSKLGLRLEGSGFNKTVALTFDDGPSRYTQAVLRILTRKRIKATFFLMGKNVEKSPQIAREIIQRGHRIGNHTYDHQRADRYGDLKLLIGQIQKTEKIFGRYLRGGNKFLQRNKKLYRPAYGAITDRQIAKVNRLGYKSFAWSIDTQDWFFKNPTKIYRAVADNLHEEAVILMHDGGGKRMNTIKALPMIIDECHSRGYSFVTLDEYISAVNKTPARYVA